jgi:hypothetical protein
MLADSVELIPLWQAVGRLGSLGMIAFIYRDHKIQPLDPFPSQLNPLHSLTPSLRSNLIFYAHLRLGLPSVSDFIYFVCATCSAYLILEVIAQIFGEEYKLCSSSLCNFVELPATSSLLVPYTDLSTPFWNAFNILPVVWETKFHTQLKQQVKVKLILRFFMQQTGRQLNCSESSPNLICSVVPTCLNIWICHVIGAFTCISSLCIMILSWIVVTTHEQIKKR